jgi:hypothetical protein
LRDFRPIADLKQALLEFSAASLFFRLYRGCRNAMGPILDTIAQ